MEHVGKTRSGTAAGTYVLLGTAGIRRVQSMRPLETSRKDSGECNLGDPNG